MNESRDWPLDIWLKIAVMQLGLSPSEFWKMSLLDWFVLTRRPTHAAMTQDDLTQMEKDYDTGN